jgi:glycosyltransferase involved in cell wall biosynthesis
MSVLTIYTNKFPYGKAETFLEAEVLVLTDYFEKIYIVPFQEDSGIRILPDNVEVLSPVQNKKWPALKLYFSGLLSFWLLFKIPELQNELKSTSILKAVKYLGYTVLTKNRLYKILPSELCVHYSYWLNFSAFSLALLKMEGRIKTLVSRAHGFDLYEERGEHGLKFIRAATLKYSDKLYLISEHGRDYISEAVPQYSQKYFLSRLGTPEPGCINPSSDSKDLTIVSCSAINSNKRVDLILDSLIVLNSRFPKINVKWYHLGGGSEISKYIEKAEDSFSGSGVKCFFPGQKAHPDVLEFYKSMHVDLFVNVSRYEGIPVSVMEALSFGIPVIATAVGGTPEIVNDTNGLLLPENPTPDHIAEVLSGIAADRELWREKRRLSRISWEEKFNSLINYKEFAGELLSIR